MTSFLIVCLPLSFPRPKSAHRLSSVPTQTWWRGKLNQLTSYQQDSYYSCSYPLFPSRNQGAKPTQTALSERWASYRVATTVLASTSVVQAPHKPGTAERAGLRAPSRFPPLVTPAIKSCELKFAAHENWSLRTARGCEPQEGVRAAGKEEAK